jgi:phosphotransferase system enzyme I (PtsI)
MVGRAAAAAGKPAGVCGQAAADPLLARVLVGLGVSSVSMGAAALAEVGRSLAEADERSCHAAAAAALSTKDAASAKAAARAQLS